MPAARGLKSRLHVRSGAAHDDRGTGQLGKLEGHRPRVVAGRCVLLLVGPLMLFVEDDEPEVRLWREDRAPRPDDDAGLAAVDSPPLGPLLGRRQSAVQRGDPAREPGLEALERLRRERELRDQDDGPLALVENVGDGLEIDLGLPAPRDSTQQERPAGGCLVIQRCSDAAEGVGL